ncbi:MAG TPA: fructose-bisphosphatase class II, partial [Nitratidesulfovibrio sp.]|nr:fructose-bisphosphatase class II [Nitratidesulfovibrio sp.]
EKEALHDAGLDLREIHTVDTLVRSDEVFFAATGISGGTFLRGVQYTGVGAITHSVVIRGKTGTIRYIESYHNWDRLMKISSVKYD